MRTSVARRVVQVLAVVALMAGLVSALPMPVQTNSGPVYGVVEGNVTSFKGIPYATPPLGSLRWTAPKPPAPWSTPLNATRYSKICSQPTWDFLPPQLAAMQSEVRRTRSLILTRYCDVRRYRNQSRTHALIGLLVSQRVDALVGHAVLQAAGHGVVPRTWQIRLVRTNQRTAARSLTLVRLHRSQEATSRARPSASRARCSRHTATSWS